MRSMDGPSLNNCFFLVKQKFNYLRPQPRVLNSILAEDYYFSTPVQRLKITVGDVIFCYRLQRLVRGSMPRAGALLLALAAVALAAEWAHASYIDPGENDYFRQGTIRIYELQRTRSVKR